MTDLVMHLTKVAMRIASALAPTERKDWLRAMQAELEYQPQADQLSFALGCLRAMVQQRIATDKFFLWTARWVLVGGALVISLLNLRLAKLVSTIDPAFSPHINYVAAIIFALGALVTAWRGLGATAKLAAPSMAAIALILACDMLAPGMEKHGRLYQALMLEHLFFLLSATIIAMLVPHWIKARSGERA